MKITSVSVQPKFGRALTSKEKISYQKLIKDVKKTLDIQDTNAIIFDFNVPSENGKNTAIGTTWSNSANNFIPFLKNMTGLNSIQLAPQGKISAKTASPYSGTTYAFGNHLIDLDKLSSKEYGNLLETDVVENLDKNYPNDRLKREYKADYGYVVGNEEENGIQIKTLKKAFNNYKKGIENSNPDILKLQKEFSEFKNKNYNWLEKEAIYSALSHLHKSTNFKEWNNHIDKNLYSQNMINENEREKRISEIKGNKELKEIIDFEEFIQFIANKQQKESHKFLNSENIKIFGDCLIGFSQSEMWANKDCFNENMYYGSPDSNCPETNYIQAWGLPALDYTKIGTCSSPDDVSQLGISGKLLFDKFKLFFERYDGVRIDAAWQYITPFLYQVDNGNYRTITLPEIDTTVFNIVKAAQKAANKPLNNDDIILELVGLTAGAAQQKTLNQYPHLYTTEYSEYGENPKHFTERGYKRDKFYVGIGNHDSNSIIGLADNDYKRNAHTDGLINNYNFNMSKTAYKTKEYTNLSWEDKIKENFRNAKFAEIFSSAKQFFTLNDMFGMGERINLSGKVSNDNWILRIPTNFEKFYFSQLSKGYGLNLPKVLSLAFDIKGKKDEKLQAKCDELAEILRSEGPDTEDEANIAAKAGVLNNIFEY